MCFRSFLYVWLNHLFLCLLCICEYYFTVFFVCLIITFFLPSCMCDYCLFHCLFYICVIVTCFIVSSHLSLNCKGHWGTTDDFTTSFLHFSLFYNCCLPTSSSAYLVFFPHSLCRARWFWPDLMNERHDHTAAVCVSLQWSGGLCVVQLPAGSWPGLPRQ